MIHLVSHDLSESEADALARRFGWRPGPGGAQVLAARDFAAISVEDCLAEPFVGGVELGDDRLPDLGARFLRHLGAGGMGLALRTGTAYHRELVLTFLGALARRHPHWRRQIDSLERAMHELLANAMIHGNLGVASPEGGMESFEAYCAALDQALADPERFNRRVEISAAMVAGALEIAIKDQGKGYRTRPGAGEPSSDTPTPRQRGLSIIAQDAELVVEDGGRCSVIRHLGLAHVG